MKRKVLVKINVLCDEPYIPSYIRGDLERTGKYLEEWAREFNDFIRDHRSQDGVSITIEREYEEVEE